MLVPITYAAELVLDSSTQNVWRTGNMPDVSISSETPWPWIAPSENSSSGNSLIVNALPENSPYSTSYAGIFGGYSRDETDSSNNRVVVNESFASTHIYVLFGGSAVDSGNAESNRVELYAGDFDNVFGGATDHEGRAIGNTVIIHNGRSRNIYGGLADESGDAMGNTIVINDGFAMSLIGGFSRDGASENNSVTINNGTLYNDSVSPGSVYGGYSGEGPVSRNIVEIKGGQIDVSVYGGRSAGNVSNNTVSVSNGTVSGAIYGGYSSSADVVGNRIDITGGSVGTVYSALGYVGQVDSNVLNISGGEGSWAYAAYIRDNSANANVVQITGGSFRNVTGVRMRGSGKVTNTVFAVSGDHPELNQAIGVQADAGTVENTTMLLSNLTAPSASIFVAYVDGGATNLPNSPNFEVRSNKLIVEGVNRVGSVSAFDSLEIRVSDANDSSVGAAVLSTEDSVVLDNRKLILSSVEGHYVNPNEEYKLVEVTGEGQSISVNENTVVESRGTFTNLVGDLKQSWLDQSQKTTLTTEDVEMTHLVTEESKTLSESHLGTVAFLNQGAEFIADEGFAAMSASAKREEFASFAALHGGSSNYKTGSRVDVNGFTLVAGGVYQFRPNWILGGFIEAGWADSDGHVHNASGEGDHDYYGVGLASRYCFDSGLYVDGSVRLGQASTEFVGLYMQDVAHYDSGVMYTTAHFGVGRVFDLTDKIDLDVYGRYIVSWLNSDDVSLHNRYDDKFKMDSIVTHVIRAGLRMSGSMIGVTGWKVGLAYEHVFDGDADGAVNGYSLDVPSLEGNSFVAEIGTTIKLSEESHWAMDADIKGYAGDREGISGGVSVRYIF